MLGDLFQVPEMAPSRAASRRLLSAATQVVAVVLGAGLLLERIPGLPSWDTVYGEDYWEWGTQALQNPWHSVLAQFSGYEELLPRLIAQLAIYLPLAQESRWDAAVGALIAAAAGLFIFHASEGHIRSVPLRALLGTSVVLLPVATMELADSAVGAPWFLMLATFWALLWSPRTRTGIALSALVAFASGSSEVITCLFIPLVVARLIVLRRPRDHVVTAGWLLGLLVQVPGVLSSYFAGQSRLNRQQGTLHNSLAFYAHDTVLPWIGWHFAWWMQSFAGKNGATAIAAVLLAVVMGTILVTQPRIRLFVGTCVVFGFVYSIFDTTLTPHVALVPVAFDLESGSRYSLLPIFMIWGAIIMAVDCVLQRQQGAHHRQSNFRLRPAIAVSALVVVLAVNWVADFRDPGFRSTANWNWGPIAATWQHDCKLSKSGKITVKAGAIVQTLPCDRIHG